MSEVVATASSLAGTEMRLGEEATASSLAGTELRPGEEAMGAARVSSHAKQEKIPPFKTLFSAFIFKEDSPCTLSPFFPASPSSSPRPEQPFARPQMVRGGLLFSGCRLVVDTTWRRKPLRHPPIRHKGLGGLPSRPKAPRGSPRNPLAHPR